MNRRDFIKGLAALTASAFIPLNAQEKDSEYKTTDFSKDSEETLLARMLYGEARGESQRERVAIAYTALNRNHDGKKWNGENNLKDVLLKKWQYSCFNENDPNRKELMNPEEKRFKLCLAAANYAIKNPDNYLNQGQTHYHAKSSNPSWKNKLEKKEFSKLKFAHKFYKE